MHVAESRVPTRSGRWLEESALFNVKFMQSPGRVSTARAHGFINWATPRISSRLKVQIGLETSK
jgi:hypothetical protein